MFEGFRAAAIRTGFELSPADPGVADIYSMVSLTGKEDGVWVRLERLAAMHTFTTTAFLRPALPSTFAIESEGITGALAHLAGLHDVEIGEPTFDKTFRIASKDPDLIRRLVTPDVMTRLYALHNEGAPFGNTYRVTEAAVSLSRMYMWPMSEDEVVMDIPLVLSVVRALQAAAR